MRQLLLISALCFACSSSVQGDEKELRQLHQNAELAITRSDYAAAKEAYEKLLSHIAPFSVPKKSLVDWPTYIDVIYRLSKTCVSLGDEAAAEKILIETASYSPPKELCPPFYVLHARILCGQEKTSEAYAKLKQLARTVPLSQWRGEDRSFFRSLEYLLNSHYDALLHKAKRFFAAGSYDEAAAMYEELLKAIEAGYYPRSCDDKQALLEKKVRYHLAETHFFQANYEKTLALFSTDTSKNDEIDQQMLYLAALAFKEKGEYESALDCFQKYSLSGESLEQTYYDNALFEMGFFHYRQGNYAQAAEYFKKLIALKKKGKPLSVGILYLARIYLKDHQPKRAEKLLGSLAEDTSTEDPLHYEIAFLRGESAYMEENFAKAAQFFQQSLPKGAKEVQWQSGALLRLARSLVKLSEDPLKNRKAKEECFERAEKICHALLSTQDKEEALLLLAKLLLMKHKELEDQKSLCQVETLLATHFPNLSMPSKLEALLLRAESASSDQRREDFYSLACSEQFRSLPLYPYAWWCLGLFYFENEDYDPSIKALEKAFFLFDPTHDNADFLKWDAAAETFRLKPQVGLSLLEKARMQCLLSPEEKEEILYIRGLMASSLPQEHQDIVEDSFASVATVFPHGRFAKDATFALATYLFRKGEYERAQKTFLSLLKNYPKTTYAGDGAFWAAESAEKLNHRELALQLRRKVYEDYPLNSHADEAYFRMYPIAAYLGGDREAYQHLKAFSSRFPSSLLLTPASFLLGLHAEGIHEAKSYFKKAVEIFDTCYQQAHLQDPSFIYFRYKALLELARLYLKEGRESQELMEGVHLLLGLLEEFSQTAHPLASALLKESPYPSLYEEAEFTLAQLYLKMGCHKKAQDVFSQMLTHYSAAGICEGAIYASVWIQQGKLSLALADYSTALFALQIAERSGNAQLPLEERLQLRILQSECYSCQKNYDMAIQTLTKVIDTDTDSPLRLQAMLLRAEFYELDGRKELAIRQLESTAKKDGPWGLEAKQRLKDFYGIQ